ncbi:MAG: acetate/propionate family kinase [Burkholderiaceae bacterium]|jgi:acetate kinase|nr:acetate/propionate family kinase [Burkholderiaceae bacterium]
MNDVILTLNAGSSSIKFAAYRVESENLTALATGLVDGIGGAATFSVTLTGGRADKRAIAGSGPVDHKAALAAVIGWLNQSQQDCRIAAIGHRVVHGGPDFAKPILIDDLRLAQLRDLTPLAPLHQPHNLAGVDAARHAFPDATQVACFDTAFHRSHPFIADTFALPRQYYDQGIRRYGFHGLSYEFITKRLRTVAPELAAGRVIIAHLGNGASMCALREGKSISSTMGFTALDGLPMGTRCGQLDPGVVLYLITQKGMTPESVSDLLYNDCGLKGMSGLSNDMRVLADSASPRVREALQYFVARIRHELGGLAADLGGVDAIVFTGGIGEHSWSTRQAVLRGMEWLGIQLDDSANERGEQTISTPQSTTRVFVLPTDEERMIAEHTAAIAQSSGRLEHYRP